jgi:hypothetical protein
MAAADIVGGAVRDAPVLVRSRDVRLAGAVVYWRLDAAVLWAMMQASGSRLQSPSSRSRT